MSGAAKRSFGAVAVARLACVKRRGLHALDRRLQIAGWTRADAPVHIITWLARTITNTGAEPGSPSSVAIPKLQQKTGGHGFDPVIAKYWE